MSAANHALQFYKDQLDFDAVGSPSLAPRHRLVFVAQGDGGRLRHIVTREIDTIGHGVRDKWLFRCDGIEMARDGPTPLHVHAVPCLCCMIEGAMTVIDSGTAEEHCEGDWWYETNVQPIVARSTGATGTRFIRVMIAAPEFEGFRATQFVCPAEQKQYQAKGRGR